MSKNPKHRPALVGRIESMARSFSTVCSDARIMDKGDFIELYENAPTLNITDQRCFELLLIWSRAVSIDDIPELKDDERLYLDWHDEVFNARRKLVSKPRDNKMSAYATAATLFNHQLNFDHKQGLRLNGKAHDCKCYTACIEPP